MKALDVFGLQFVLIDGFADTHFRDGILRMTAYRLSPDGERIPVIGVDVTESARAQLGVSITPATETASALISMDTIRRH